MMQEKSTINIEDLSAILFFALALSVPSGYSWGAGIISIIAVINIIKTPRINAPNKTKIIALFFIVCGFFWSNTFDGILDFSNYEYLIKYGLCSLSILHLSKKPVSTKSIQWGLIIGGLSSAPLAIYQFYNIGRATGFTNAIQFGDIAIIISMGNFLFFLQEKESRLRKNLALISALASVLISLLSLSRGGWIVIPIFIIAIFTFEKDNAIRKNTIKATLALGLIFIILWTQSNLFQSRFVDAKNEANFSLQQSKNNAATSVGQRLEQWKLAWQLGKDQPISGWGDDGLIAAKQAYVNKGLADSSVMEYGHAHNEILDNWARRGVIGVIFIIFIYALPICIFHSQNSRGMDALNSNSKINALRWMGILIPIAYAIFGLSQVFFSHNSGHIFYIFSLAFIWSALNSQKALQPQHAD